MLMRHFLVFVFLVSLILGLSAQAIVDYSFSTLSTGTMENMASGTTQLLTPGVYHDNDASAVTNIGFSFKFGDTIYTQFSANSNGQFMFGSSAIYGSWVSYSYGTPLLVPLSNDNAIRSNGNLHYKLVGTAPNRRLVVEWLNVVIPATTSPSNYTYSNFQIWLYETSNRIDFVYGTMVVNSSGSQNRATFISTSSVSGSVGWLQNLTSTPVWVNYGLSFNYTQFSGNTSMGILYGYPDGSRRVFTFLPPDPLAVPNPARMLSPANGATGLSIYTTLSWDTGGGMPTSYDIYWNGSSTPVNQTGTTFNPGTLAYSTTYTWQIVPRNANGPAVDCPVWNFTTRADRTISTLPHTENFDGTWSGSPPAPDGWTVVNANYDSYKWHQGSTLLPVSTPYYAAGEGNTNDWLISPPIDLTSQNARIKWWDACLSSYYSFTYKVAVSTTTDQVSAFTNLLGTYTCNSSTWTKHMLNLDAFAGHIVYVALWQTASSSTSGSFGIDNFIVETLPTSPIFSLTPNVSEWDFGELLSAGTRTKTFTISNLGVGTITLTSVTASGLYFSISSPPADLSLTADESTSFTVMYAPLETGNHSGSLNIAYGRETVTVALTGVCQPDAVIYPAELPYLQDFDTVNTNEMPLGWANLGASYTVQMLTGYPFSPPNCLALTVNSYGTGVVSLPTIIAPGRDIRLRFQARRGGYGSCGLQIGWLAAPGVASSFVSAQSITLYYTSYSEFSAVFSEIGDNLCLALKATGDQNVFSLVDDVVIEELTVPVFTYTPASLWFGEQMHAVPAAWQNVTVTNIGGGLLHLTTEDISLTGDDAAQFGFDSVNLPVDLACNQSVVIPVRMTPLSTGSINASLQISYAAQVYTVALSGSGLQPGIICIGDGTADLGLPLDTYYEYNYSQSMYFQNEINVSGKQIEKIWLHWTGGVFADTAVNWTIYMGQVSWEEFYYSNYWVPWYDLSQVFSGTVFLYEASYWLEITLDTPFPYNNIQNLVISVDENTPGYEMGYYSDFSCTASTLNRGIKISADGYNPSYTNPSNGTLVQGYPNIRLLLTDIPTLYPPLLSSPVPEAQNLPLEGFAFEWEPDPRSVPADDYTLYVSSSDNSGEFFSTPYVYPNVTSPFNPENIPYGLGQTWYWTVVANAAGYTSAYAWPPHQFNIEPYNYAHLPYAESVDAEQYPPGWTQTYDGTLVYGPWSVVNTNSAGGEPCEFRCDWYWGVNGTGRLISPPLYTEDIQNLKVTFKYGFEALGGNVFPSLKYSHDLVTWYDTGWNGPGVYGSSLGTADVYLGGLDASVTWLGWTMSGDYLSFNFWWLDDFLITEATLVAPQNLLVESLAGDISLSWTPAPGATGYNIYRSDDPYASDWGAPVGYTTQTSWSEPVAPSNELFYKVTAVY